MRSGRVYGQSWLVGEGIPRRHGNFTPTVTTEGPILSATFPTDSRYFFMSLLYMCFSSAVVI